MIRKTGAKKKKTIVHAVLIIVLSLILSATASIIPTTKVDALTYGPFEYDIVDHNSAVEITGYTGPRGPVSIPKEIDERPVRYIGSDSFSHAELTSLTIPYNVVTIEDHAFYYCTSLTSVKMSDSVTTLGQAAFFGCAALTDVVITNFVTSIGDYAFSACTSMTAIDVNSGNTHYASVDGVLFNKAKTTLIQYPAGKVRSISIPEGVTTIGNQAFYAASHLSSVTVPGGVMAIGSYGFASCSYLTKMTFMGDAPTCGTNWINDHNPDLIIYYYTGASGFTNPWYGVQTVAIAPPGPPTNLVATADDGQVQLSWDAPVDDGGSPIDHYVIFQGGLDVAHATGTTTTVTGLTNGVSYSFAVAAHNSAGVGPMSTVVSATPHAPLTLVVPPDAPTGFTATPGDGQVQLSWDAPADDGGASIDHYVIYQNGLDVSHVTGTTETVTGLTNGASYNFAAAAHNSAGVGPMSTVVSVTPSATATVPDPPANLTATPGDGQVQLSWDPPANNGGMAVTGYRVYWGPDPNSSNGPIVVNGTSYLHDGLENGQTFYYQVAAVNSMGEGDKTTVVSSIPSASNFLPSPPTGLIASVTNGMVILTWSASSNDGQNVTEYRVYRGTTPSSIQLLASTTDATYQDDNVSRDQTYYYEVSAINADGESDRSSTLNVTVPASSTSPSFFETLEGQMAVASLVVIGVGVIGYILWRSRRH